MLFKVFTIIKLNHRLLVAYEQKKQKIGAILPSKCCWFFVRNPNHWFFFFQQESWRVAKDPESQHWRAQLLGFQMIQISAAPSGTEAFDRQSIGQRQRILHWNARNWKQQKQGQLATSSAKRLRKTWQFSRFRMEDVWFIHWLQLQVWTW